MRVPGKPKLVNPAAQPAAATPVLGMFRDDLDELATDRADFIGQVTREPGYRLPSGQASSSTRRGGNVGDCALLCSSPKELDFSRNPRLPLVLRDRLPHAIKAVPVDDASMQAALAQFDDTVGRIETCISQEAQSGRIISSSEKNPSHDPRCEVCDSNTCCPDHQGTTLQRVPGIKPRCVDDWVGTGNTFPEPALAPIYKCISARKAVGHEQKARSPRHRNGR